MDITIDMMRRKDIINEVVKIYNDQILDNDQISDNDQILDNKQILENEEKFVNFPQTIYSQMNQSGNGYRKIHYGSLYQFV